MTGNDSPTTQELAQKVADTQSRLQVLETQLQDDLNAYFVAVMIDTYGVAPEEGDKVIINEQVMTDVQHMQHEFADFHIKVGTVGEIIGKRFWESDMPMVGVYYRIKVGEDADGNNYVFEVAPAETVKMFEAWR